MKSHCWRIYVKVLLYIKSGIPQGSILGPTLFVLFINDLRPLHELFSLNFFADGATLRTDDPIKSKINYNLAQNMQMLLSRQNNMHITYDKTNYMILGRANTQNVPQQFDIRIDDKHIKKTQNHKLLGMHIDDNFLGLLI